MFKMIIRSFLLFESFDNSNGLILKKPFSIISFDDFPTGEFNYAISVSLEDYEQSGHNVDLKMFDPNGDLYAVWPPYQFKGSPNKEARSIIYNHANMSFKMPGTYKYQVLVNGQVLGQYTLVVLNKRK